MRSSTGPTRIKLYKTKLPRFVCSIKMEIENYDTKTIIRRPDETQPAIETIAPDNRHGGGNGAGKIGDRDPRELNSRRGSRRRR